LKRGFLPPIYDRGEFLSYWATGRTVCATRLSLCSPYWVRVPFDEGSSDKQTNHDGDTIAGLVAGACWHRLSNKLQPVSEYDTARVRAAAARPTRALPDVVAISE
jgi:hypothetical protein